MRRCARATWTASCAVVLVWLAGARVARAESLSGDYDLYAGGHLMVLATEVCEQDSDLVSCSGQPFFAGFQLGGHIQLRPWFAVGARLSGTIELSGRSRSTLDGFIGTIDRWIWRGLVRARFDPPLWPKALWIGAEVGAAIVADTFEVRDFGDAAQRRSTSSQAAFSAGLALGWDFVLHQNVIAGVELQAHMILLPPLAIVEGSLVERDQPSLPYVSAGAHVGYRF